MNNFPLEIFVLDVVTICLFIALLVQSYYIYRLHHKLTEQHETMTQLKEMVFAIYEDNKASIKS